VRFTTTSPDVVRTAAVKPAPVNSLKRSSAFKSASAFFASKLCRVSACAIHHDLCGHRILRCKIPKFYARFRLPRKLNNALAVN
jgi:hypothetical protein